MNKAKWLVAQYVTMLVTYGLGIVAILFLATWVGAMFTARITWHDFVPLFYAAVCLSLIAVSSKIVLYIKRERGRV